MDISHIARLLIAGELLSAIKAIRQTISTDLGGDYAHQLDRLEETSRNNLRYFVEGFDDPERERLERWAKLELWELALALRDAERLARGAQDPSAGLYERYAKASRTAGLEQSLAKVPLEGAVPLLASQKLFEYVWLARSFSEDELQRLLAIEDSYLQCLIISAMHLGLDEYPSLGRLNYFVRILRHYPERDELRVRAITSLVLAMGMAWWGLYSPSLQGELVALLAQDASLEEDLREALLWFYRERTTDKVSEEVHQHLRQSMERMSTDVRERLERMLFGEAESSPEEKLWQDEFQSLHEIDSQQAQHIRKLIEQGEDVMFSQLADAKRHPLFREPSSWFASFGMRHELVAEIHRSRPDLYRNVASLSITLCDSDLYSILLSMSAMPAHLDGALHAPAEVTGELPQDMRPPRSVLTMYYVRDLYRFARLYQRRDEHTDWFGLMPLEACQAVWGDALGVGLFLEQIHAICTRQGRYEEALAVCQSLIASDPTQGRYYIQAGQSYIKLGAYEEALSALAKARLIEGEQASILKLEAQCRHQLGDYEEVIRLLRLILPREQGRGAGAILLRIATAHIALEQWQEALSVGYEYELTYQEDERSKRVIAFALLNLGRYAESNQCYQQILAGGSPSNSDRLNAGHSALLLGDRATALKGYHAIYIEVGGDAFGQLWSADTAMLLRLGVASALIDALPQYLELIL